MASLSLSIIVPDSARKFAQCLFDSTHEFCKNPRKLVGFGILMDYCACLIMNKLLQYMAIIYSPKCGHYRGVRQAAVPSTAKNVSEF